MNHYRTTLSILGLALVAGCATVTFKRGASPGGMAADEQACRATAADETGFVECMRKRGWFVLDRSAPAAEAKPKGATDKRKPETAPVVTSSGEPARPAPDPARASVPTAAESAPPTSKADVMPPPDEAPAPRDPLERVDVASWWKLGGSAADLDRAIAACVAKLGAAHRPDPAAITVTVGLRDCLRDAGWYAAGTSTSR